jgi:hypothetical protein
MKPGNIRAAPAARPSAARLHRILVARAALKPCVIKAPAVTAVLRKIESAASGGGARNERRIGGETRMKRSSGRRNRRLDGEHCVIVT